MKKNKIWFYLMNFLIVLVVSALTIYKIVGENGKETLLYLSELSVFSIVVLTTVFLVNYFLEGLIISFSIKEYEKDFTPVNGFAVHSVGGLFSAITPLKSGYLPSIAYTYSKYDVKAESIIKSMAKTSLPYQLVCFLVNIVAVIIFSANNQFIEIGGLELSLLTVSLIGLVYNIVLMAGYFVLILSPWLHHIVIKVIAYLLFETKQIKDKDQYVNDKTYKMKLIRDQLKMFFKNIKQFVLLCLLYVIRISIYSSLPYISYLLLSKTSFSVEIWLFSIVLCNLISYITNIIPIPGASGTAEIVFLAVFGVVFNESVLTSTMLVWRIFSYFIHIIVGFIVFMFMLNYKKKRINLIQ